MVPWFRWKYEWAHIWAVPCNSKVECYNGYDEESCDIKPNWVLTAILVFVFAMIFITKFIYLYKNVNHEVQNISIPVVQPNLGSFNYHWFVAILINDGRFDEIKEFYVKEFQFHGSEPNTFCCLKVCSYCRYFQLIVCAVKH